MRSLIFDYLKIIGIVTPFFLACLEWSLIVAHSYYPSEVSRVVNEVCNVLGIDQ